MVTDKATTLELLARAGLPQFEPGQDGYPIPGKVIKYYREHMTYTDRDSKERHWTQVDLAQRLGLSEIMVNLMEKQNKGLDSIERRRTLATLLRIPPVLLGLGSLDLIVEIATGHTTNQTDTKRAKVSKDTIKQYQTTFKAYETLFAEGLTYHSVSDIERWMNRIEQDTKTSNVEDKNALLRIWWNLEILCAKVYGSDLHNWAKTFEHIDNAKEVAAYLDNRDLQASSLFYASVYHTRQGRLGLARMDIDGALTYVKNISLQTRAKIYTRDAILHAIDTSVMGITLAQKLFDQVETCIANDSDIYETKMHTFSKDDYLVNRAYTLADIGKPAKALELLDEAAKYINPSNRREIVFLNILRAKCYIEQRKPDYEYGVELLESSIVESNTMKVQRHINHIERLYAKLLISPYGNSPDVTGLGIMLQELQATNN